MNFTRQWAIILAMTERVYHSVEELFRNRAPDLLEFLGKDDLFWKRVSANTITDTELDGHQALIEELGMSPASSAVAKAIQILRDSRRTALPTPVDFCLDETPTY